MYSPARHVIVSGNPLIYSDGGIPAYTRRLLAALDHLPEGWRYSVAIPEQRQVADLPSRCERLSFPRIFSPRKPLLDEISAAIGLGTWCRRNHPGSILITPADHWSPFTVKRSIAVTHDALPEVDVTSRGGKVRSFYRRLCLRYASRSSRWVTTSRFAASEIASTYGGTRTPEVLENWLDSRFSSRPDQETIAGIRRKYKLPDAYILYVGGYRKYKNVEYIIREYAEARKSLALPPLVLSGRVSATTHFNCATHETIRGCGLGASDVIESGFIDDADLPAIYAGASLFVSASLHEGFGYPPVEAVSMGCPVLVSDRTSFKEVVPVARNRFDPDQIGDLGLKMKQAILEPQAFVVSPSARHREESGIARLLQLVLGLT